MNEKGITLIALVVTIIVLIMLSSITINGLISSDGILTKKNEYENIYDKKQDEAENTENTIKSQWGNVINKTGIDPEVNFVK